MADPVLALPDHANPFEVHTDASDYARGGVLMQEGHPIALESRKLNETERKYTVHEKGNPAGPIARSGQDAETQSQDPYAVLRPSERPPPLLYQGIGPCNRCEHAVSALPREKLLTTVQSISRHPRAYKSYELL